MRVVLVAACVLLLGLGFAAAVRHERSLGPSAAPRAEEGLGEPDSGRRDDQAPSLAEEDDDALLELEVGERASRSSSRILPGLVYRRFVSRLRANRRAPGGRVLPPRTSSSIRRSSYRRATSSARSRRSAPPRRSLSRSRHSSGRALGAARTTPQGRRETEKEKKERKEKERKEREAQAIKEKKERAARGKLGGGSQNPHDNKVHNDVREEARAALKNAEIVLAAARGIPFRGGSKSTGMPNKFVGATSGHGVSGIHNGVSSTVTGLAGTHGVSSVASSVANHVSGMNNGVSSTVMGATGNSGMSSAVSGAGNFPGAGSAVAGHVSGMANSNGASNPVAQPLSTTVSAGAGGNPQNGVNGMSNNGFNKGGGQPEPSDGGGGWLGKLQGAWNGAVTNVQEGLQGAQDYVQGAAGAVHDRATEAIANAEATIASAHATISGKVAEVQNGIQEGVQNGVQAARDKAAEIQEGVQNGLDAAREGIQDGVQAARDKAAEIQEGVQNGLEAAREGIQEGVQNGVQAARDKAAEIQAGVQNGLDAARNGIEDGVQAARDKAAELQEGLQNGVQAARDKAAEIQDGVQNGLDAARNGIEDGVQAAKDKAAELQEGLQNGVQAARDKAAEVQEGVQNGLDAARDGIEDGVQAARDKIDAAKETAWSAYRTASSAAQWVTPEEQKMLDNVDTFVSSQPWGAALDPSKSITYEPGVLPGTLPMRGYTAQSMGMTPEQFDAFLDDFKANAGYTSPAINDLSRTLGQEWNQGRVGPPCYQATTCADGAPPGYRAFHRAAITVLPDGSKVIGFYAEIVPAYSPDGLPIVFKKADDPSTGRRPGDDNKLTGELPGFITQQLDAYECRELAKKDSRVNPLACDWKPGDPPPLPPVPLATNETPNN